MEPIEIEELNYLRIALYGIKRKDIAVEIEVSEVTATNALKHGLGSKETWDKLRALAKRVSLLAKKQSK